MSFDTDAIPTGVCVPTPETAPYLSFILVVRNSKLDLLEQALCSVRERAPRAEVVCVETMGDPQRADEIKALVEKHGGSFSRYAGPRGEWTSEWYAVDDMAAARQHAFGLAHGTWRAWIDDDDRIPGPEETEKLLKAAGRWRPEPVGGQTPVDGARDASGAQVPEDLESLLRRIEKDFPKTTLIHCPYLYRRDENGVAIQWLPRERFARWDDPSRFFWSEAAHEVLVPRNPADAPYAELPHLLWVHEKKWNHAEEEYSRKRHSAIMLEQWLRGDRTFRRARYLAGFATIMPDLAPRELEFLMAGLDLAYTDVDRYRANTALGAYFSRRGLHWDAKDCYHAAHALHPEIPDAWYAAGQSSVDREDWAGAVTYLRRGVECKLSPAAEVNPRDHAIRYPSMLAVALRRCAEFASLSGDSKNAVALLAEAAIHARRVAENPASHGDEMEAMALKCKAENERDSETAMHMLHEAWRHLKNNDESQKAAVLVDCVPFDKLNHPHAVEMESWAAKIRRHIDSPKAYSDFYNEQMETGWAPITLEMATLKNSHPRVKWAIDWVKAHNNRPSGTLSVLDIGCCDGIVGLPLLATCPEVDYVGIDVGEKHIEHFRKLIRDTSLMALKDGGIDSDDRVVLRVGTVASALESNEVFDVIMAGEIIEHVADPVKWLASLRHRLAPKGVLLLTTPWGSYDEGHPPETTTYGTPRDERGHLRAYTPETLAHQMRAAGYMVDEIARIGSGAGLGDAMVSVGRAYTETAMLTMDAKGLPATSRHGGSIGRPVAVLVPGALWDWNGSTIDRDGMGASEGQIKMLGERLAAMGRRFDVFGPVPAEEVYRGVGYFQRPAIRHAHRDSKILVSRAPSAIRGESRPAVLWAQDTFYADLNDATAAYYEHIVCVSEWHKDYTIKAHGLSPESAAKIRVIPNHVDERLYLPGIETGWKGVKKPNQFIYASSPDRGVVKLLELWRRVREMVPGATLKIFYGFRGAGKLASGSDSAWNKRYLDTRRAYERLRWQPGVIEVGMANPLVIALAFQESVAMLYPGEFFETYGTVASEACASGCVPVTSYLGGLVESADCDGAWLVGEVDEQTGAHKKGYDEAWLAGVRAAVGMTSEKRQEMARQAVKKFGWEAVSAKWAAVLA